MTLAEGPNPFHPEVNPIISVTILPSNLLLDFPSWLLDNAMHSDIITNFTSLGTK
jgi:hypothetical protein